MKASLQNRKTVTKKNSMVSRQCLKTNSQMKIFSVLNDGKFSRSIL